MCQIDIDRESSNSTMIQGVSHNLHTSVGDLRMLAEVCKARQDDATAHIVSEVAETVAALVNVTLDLYRLACEHETHVHAHTHDAVNA
jgi:hypothetical protein